ncbi:MAG: cytochrome c-type biogenesis protein CcmH [Gemmatimonadetes bacterium]|nr:cytochrome c-type biogenesis protein CcmH [Gemmatimonadota bacterium]
MSHEGAGRPTPLHRRTVVRGLGAGALLLAVAPAARALAQAAADAGAGQDAAPGAGDPAGTQSVAGGVEMTSDSYKPVRRPPKPGAARVVDDKQVEVLERKLACPCPCTLDIYTCRTTDFTCGISPAVHRDIMALVEGGHTADEIMDALLGTYGDFILTSPRKRGFNLLAWIAPAAAITAGGVAIGALLRRWRRPVTAPAAPAAGAVPPTEATPEELARLEAALREER